MVTTAPATRTAVTLGVVVVGASHVTPAGLVASVSSVLEQSVAPQEVVVVVDDAELASLRTSELGDLAVVLAQGKGVAACRNAGVDACSTDVIAFINAGAIARPDWLERLADAYSNPFVVGVGGSSRPNWHGGRPGWFPAEFGWVVGCDHPGLPQKTSDVGELLETNMSFRRRTLVARGGFRPLVGSGEAGDPSRAGEETDFCIRALQGLDDGCLVFDPAAVVVQPVPVHAHDRTWFTRRCRAQGKATAMLRRDLNTHAHPRVVRLDARRLGRGVLRGVSDSIRSLDMNGVRRSWAIVVGGGCAALGYLSARFAMAAADPVDSSRGGVLT